MLSYKKATVSLGRSDG